MNTAEAADSRGSPGATPEEPRIAIGIDVGGTSVKAIVANERGQVLATQRAPSDRDAAALVATVRSVMDSLRAPAAGASRLGLATAGVPHPEGRRVQFCPGSKLDIEGIDWAGALDWREAICLLNDANAALLGEAWIGAARGRRHALMLTLGTGVGGGILVDGRLLRGARGRAGHVGHISLFSDRRPSILGMPGSLEDAVGEQTIASRTGGRNRSTADLLEAYRAGDPAATRVWLAAVDALARGLASLINVLDPEIVILGGGIAQAGAALFEPLERAMVRVEWRPDGRGVPIIPAQLGDVAGAIGAARQALEDEAVL